MTDHAASSRIRVSSPTERRNPATVAIDSVSTAEALAMVHAEDARVIPAVHAVLPTLVGLVDEAVARIHEGGTVHYFGAGTSGRLGVLDAAELPPTYGPPNVVVAHHAGGPSALLQAAEGQEEGGEEDEGEESDNEQFLNKVREHWVVHVPAGWLIKTISLRVGDSN